MNKTTNAPAGSLPRMVSEQCRDCDWWEQNKNTVDGTSGPACIGYCALFHKQTNAAHGSKCTGWQPANAERSGPRTQGSADTTDQL